jgi:hypothetical protein
MRFDTRVMHSVFFALLLCSLPENVSSENTVPIRLPCVTVHVRLSGKSIDAPDVITVRTKDKDTTVSSKDGCLTVPSELLAGKAVDVFFTVPGSRIYLTKISPSFLDAPWDVDLEDKKFGAKSRLPKHARVKEACEVLFHGGEPEIELLQTGCRSPLRDNATK